jgi:hypothetical protein
MDMDGVATLVLTSTVPFGILAETRMRPVIAKFSLSPMFNSVDFSKPQSIGAGNILLCKRTSFYLLFLNGYIKFIVQFFKNFDKVVVGFIILELS